MARRKPIRLQAKLYSDQGRVFSITICTADRRPVFHQPSFATKSIALLHQVSRDFETALHASCLMPDHAHLLAGPVGSRSLVEFICAWKSLTGREWKRAGGSGLLWQRSFYDHALRREESIEVAARYILNNPVRAGLVTDWRDYPYSWARHVEH